MKAMFRRSVYTRKFGIEIDIGTAAYSEFEFYKVLIWINLWDWVWAIFIFKKASNGI